MQFLVTVKNLELSLGALIEPFFCTLGLYDLKTGSRLSENFHFDLNPPDVLTGHMEVSKSLADKITLAKHAVFSVTDRHEKIYLILKIERVLQGDPAELADLYTKPKPKRTPVELQALSKKARQATIYLSDFRQTFAWGMMQLFEDTGELKLPGNPPLLTPPCATLTAHSLQCMIVYIE
jgi:ribosomal protein L23